MTIHRLERVRKYFSIRGKAYAKIVTAVIALCIAALIAAVYIWWIGGYVAHRSIPVQILLYCLTVFFAPFGILLYWKLLDGSISMLRKGRQEIIAPPLVISDIHTEDKVLVRGSQESLVSQRQSLLKSVPEKMPTEHLLRATVAPNKENKI